jgi:hypothetical protein
MKNILRLGFVLLLTGCGATTSVNLEKAPELRIVAYDGDRLAVSKKRQTVASLASKTFTEPNGKTFKLLLIAENKKASQFELDTNAVKVTINGQPAKVHTYNELVKAEKKARKRQLIATAFAGAMQSYSASMSGQQRTSGTYSGSTYGTGGSYNSYGSFNSTTYNAAAAQAASAQAQANTNAQIDRIGQRSEANLDKLKGSYLKPTTMSRGTVYGGTVTVSAPKLKKGAVQTVQVKVSLGSDEHTFVLIRQFD